MELKSEYFDDNNNPRLMPSFCAFVDILGFKDLCTIAFDKDQGNAMLSKLHRIITNQSEELTPKQEAEHSTEWWHEWADKHVTIGKEDFLEMIDNPTPNRKPYKPNWHVTFFTDNVVLGQIVDPSTAEGEIGWVLLQMMFHQILLAEEGFFVRGGLSLEKLFIDNNMVFGPALVQAHDIEATATFPRIVLADDLLELLNIFMENYGDPYYSPENDHVLVDSDNKLFINYLAAVFSEAKDEDSIWQYMNKHKTHIENCLKKYKDEPPVETKYKWLANYHNYICGEHSDYTGYNDGYLIPGTFGFKNPHRLIKEPRTKHHKID